MGETEHPFSMARYRRILRSALDAGYVFRRFTDPERNGLRVYLRHDVDNSIADALRVAAEEQALGVTATYLFLLRSRNYNALCGTSVSGIREIAAMGHAVGLHHSMEAGDRSPLHDDPAKAIRADADLLADEIGLPVEVFSLHNPAEQDDFQLRVPGLVNCYASEFFHDVKYLSESNFRWREGCPSELFPRRVHEAVQLLIHPMTYCERLEDDRSALLYFLAQKLEELMTVNCAQNRVLREQGLDLHDVARHLSRAGNASLGMMQR